MDCPHSGLEITVASTLSPFDWMWVTLMPVGNHERDMGEIVRGHNAICAMAIPHMAWTHVHLTVNV